MELSAERAIRAVQVLAGERELEVTPLVVADRSNLVLRLAPHPIVARVAMATSLVRVGMAWLAREVEIARFLADRGALVTVPSAAIPPGPYEREGMVISFWELETLAGESVAPHAAGVALGLAHRHLADYPRDRLQEWGAFEETAQVLEHVRRSPLIARDELLRLERGHERAKEIVGSARARSASFQAVHGDAHIGNVLATARGAVWTDWEDAFVGPVEFDLACLQSKLLLFGEDREAIEAMLAAYPGSWNRELAADLALVRNVQVIAWLVVFSERHPELLPRMRARLERLPHFGSGGGA